MSISAVLSHDSVCLSFKEHLKEDKQKQIPKPEHFQTVAKKSCWCATPLRKALDEFSADEWPTACSLLLRAFCAKEYSKLQPQLKEIMRDLTKDQLHGLVEKVALAQLQPKAPPKLLENCLAVIGLDDLQNALKASKEVLDTQIFRMAQNEKEAIQNIAKPTIKIGNTIVQYFHSIIDTVMMAFSFFEIGKEPGSSWEASHMLTIYGKFVAAPLLLLGTLCTIFTTPIALLVTIGIIVALLAALIIYIKWFKPCPDNLNPCENLTMAAADGTLEPVLARDAILDQVITSLASSSDGVRQHPLLCGPSGVGKTEIIKGLAQRIHEGNVPACLKGKKLFVVNTARLIQDSMSGETQDKLQRLLKRIGRHKNGVIIFFDEVQVAMDEKHRAKLGNTLKSVLDTTPGSLPYCIAATTDKDYDKYIATDIQYARRFKKIPVASMKEKQTLLVLREMMRREAPDISISEKVLKEVYHKTQDDIQPAAAKRLLASAISEIRFMQSDIPSAEELQKLEEYNDLFSRYRQSFDEEGEDEIWTQLTNLKDELNAFRTERAGDIAILQKIRIAKHQKTHLKKAMFQLAYQLHNHNPKPERAEKLQKLFTVASNFLLPHLSATIEALSKQCTRPTQIDENLLTKICQSS